MKVYEKIILEEIYYEYLNNGNSVNGHIVEANFYVHDKLYNNAVFCSGIQQLKKEGYIGFPEKKESVSITILNYDNIILTEKGKQHIKNS